MLSLDRPRIAVIEDDPIMGESLVQWLAVEGYEPAWWRTGAEAMAALQDRAPDALICDMRLPDMTGEDVFRGASPRLRDVPVLFITAYGDIDQAVRLIRAGADDYMTKPFEIREFLARLNHLLERRAGESSEEESVLGTSEPMRRVESVLRRVAPIQSTVLFTGESGVGKEVAARLLHRLSPRAAQPFMAVNCAAIPGELMESELLGHEKGAFTGAHARHDGYAERARDGVLFLDEVVDLPAALQTKLLRLVQERVFFRVGGERPIAFKARLICATNADVERAVREGRFREDLYYRLNVIPVHIPPLRERKDDILPLARAFISEHATAFGSRVRGLTTIAEDALLEHSWPGNVRELRNRTERAVALSNGPWLGPVDLFPSPARQASESAIGSLAEARDAAERRQIAAALEQTGGDVRAAAEQLGVGRSTLFEKIRKLGLQRHARDDAR
jgi:DNA-binding NtrC family response regulator